MNAVTVSAIARHVLTFVGGVLVSTGWIDSGTVTELTGAVATVAGVILSIWEKAQR